MNLSPQQEQALHLVQEWLDNEDRPNQVFRLFGYAGTGKTTLCAAPQGHGRGRGHLWRFYR